ncbi:MAG: TonB family protein [Gemmatimonadota bacterium]
MRLPESARKRQRSFGSTTVSTAFHITLIGGAVIWTGGAVTDAITTDAREQNLTFIERPVVPQEKNVHVVPSQLVPTNVVPVNVEAVDLTRIPTGIPPISSMIGSIPVDSFAVASLVDSSPGTVAPLGNETWLESTVEKPVTALGGNLSPIYPRSLAAAGVEGVVHAQFVVDTTGRVEMGTVRFVGEPNQLFARAVTDALRRMRFVPAEVGKSRVRQLVEQPFAFAIRR